MTKKHAEEIKIEKSTTVAFCSLEGLHVTPFIKPDGRVGFSVRGNVTKILAKLNTNPSVPILDFLQRLDTIRSIIFTLKGGRNDNHKT